MPGVVHGMRSLFLQDEDGQVLEATSISAGLDYPGVGPEHAMLAAQGRAEYYSATDEEALAGFQLLAATEGIVPALEPAHAIGWLAREAGRMRCPTGSTVLVTLSGPRRQGRRAGRGAARASSTVSSPVDLEAHLREQRAAGPEAARSVRHRWARQRVVRRRARGDRRGADAVEIGIPFSDPIMDGRTIQEASQRALDLGATPMSVIDAARRRSTSPVPLIVMTYYNLVAHARARARSRRRCATSGVDGAILPDLPLDELDGWGDAADADGRRDGPPRGADDHRRTPARDLRAVRRDSSTACRCSA